MPGPVKSTGWRRRTEELGRSMTESLNRFYAKMVDTETFLETYFSNLEPSRF